MPRPGDDVLALLDGFADPSRRPAATASLAARVGGAALTLFSPDPELGVLLPAPGLPQTLHHAADYRRFVEECRRAGELRGALPDRDGTTRPAHGCAAPGDVVAVLTGAGLAPATLELVTLRPVLTLLGALFTSERRVALADAHVLAARLAVERAGAVTHTLQAVRTRLEAALHEVDHARAAADEANRAKSDFLATMSHELRTPLNAIIGYTDLLELGIPGSVTPEQHGHLDRIRSSSRHLLMLINDVLDLARIEAGRMRVQQRPAHAEAAVRDAVALIAPQASARGIAIDVVPAPEGATYVGDEDRVRQIVTNLLSNAVKFTPRDGTVTIRSARTHQRPPASPLLGDGAWTYIQVEDTGIGIAPSALAGIFRPFVQADAGHHRARDGSGLGLTISRQLARLMGGDLTVESTLGRGSCFRLWLPADAPVPGALDETIRVGDPLRDARA